MREQLPQKRRAGGSGWRAGVARLGDLLRRGRLTRLLVAVVGGWFLVTWLAVSHQAQRRFASDLARDVEELRESAAAVTFNFERSLSFLHLLPATIAEHMAVSAALHWCQPQAEAKEKSWAPPRPTLASPPDFSALNRHLAEEARALDIDLLYLLAPSGECVASSNYEQPDSLLGKNYADRGYFQSARRGERGKQYAFGRTTKLPGLYFSAPVREGSEVIGVAVVKINIRRLARWFERFDCFVSDQAGVVVLASDKRLENLALPATPVWTMTPEARQQLYGQERMGLLPMAPIGVGNHSYQAATFPGGDSRYLVVRNGPNKEGYTIFTYRQLREEEELVAWRREFTALIGVAGAALILLTFGVRFHLRDMRRAVAVAEAANRAKSAFLANMSHEILTPMNGIIGMTELCLAANREEQQGRYLEAVKKSADNLLAIINDLFAYSEIEAGHHELDWEPFLLRTAIGQAVQSLEGKAAGKGLTVQCHLAPVVPDALLGDPRRLRQVLLNLLGNAIKFSNHGQVVLKVQLVREEAESCLLSFRVSDEGLGIAPEKIKKIFEPFIQGDLSTTKSFGGTGLGLSIAQKFVELMGGEISVESEEGQGSTFTFTARFGRQPQPATLPAGQGLAGSHALVVDDLALNRTILVDFLGRWGVTVVEAESGQNALAALANATRPFDFVLIDGQMPECDGWQLVAEIRRQPAYDPLFCVLMPSVGRQGDAQRCRTLKIDGYLSKPFQSQELYDLLSLLLASRPLAMPSQCQPVTRHVVLEYKDRRSVLVAEDVPVNQMLIKTILLRQGHAVTVAENGEVAVRTWQSGTGSYDLIFMDVQMPVLDGFAATRQIRALEAGSGKHIPIIAMTAYASREDRELCLAAGMDDYIGKPFKPEEISRALNRLAGVSEEVLNPEIAAAMAPGRDKIGSGSRQEIFNRRKLQQLLGEEPTRLASFVAMFLESGKMELPALARAIASRDLEAARRHIHTLKGMAGNVGADRLAWSCGALDGYAKVGDLAKLKEGLATLQREYQRFKETATPG